jgi:outer membrane receptor protein involved in Fe transport
VLDDVHVFSPTMVLDFCLGYNRTYTNSSIASDGFDPTTLGFPAYLGQNSTLIAIPRISMSDSNDAGLSTTAGSISPFDQYQIFTTLTKVKNAHSLKVGADLRMEKTSAIGGGYSAGTFTFGNNLGNNWVSSGTGGVAQPFGSSFASFLLGLPSAGQFDITTPATYSNKYFGFFFQDDWHVTPNLTVNLGLRLEHETVVVESNNKMVVGVDPSATNGVTTAAICIQCQSCELQQASREQPDLIARRELSVHRRLSVRDSFAEKRLYNAWDLLVAPCGPWLVAPNIPQ